MDREPVGEGGLAAGRGAGDEDRPAVPAGYLLRDMGDGFILKGFVDTDKGPKLVAQDHLVQVGDLCAVQDAAPLVRFLESGQVLGQFGGRSDAFDLRGMPRHLQHEARFDQLQPEYPRIAGTGEHFPVEVFALVPAGIHVEMLIRPEAEEFYRILLPDGLVVTHSLAPGPPFDGNGQVSAGDVVHLPIKLPQLVGSHRMAGNGHIQTGSEGMLDPHAVIRPDLFCRHEHDEAQAPFIDPASFVVGVGQRPEFRGTVDRVVQLIHDAAGHAAEYLCRMLCQLVNGLLQNDAWGKRCGTAIDGDSDHQASPFSCDASFCCHWSSLVLT